MGLSLLRLVFRGFSKLDVGLDDITRDMSWYCRSPLPSESDVMTKADQVQSATDHHHHCYTPNQRGIHRFVFELRVGIVHVHIRDVLSKPLVVIS